MTNPFRFTIAAAFLMAAPIVSVQAQTLQELPAGFLGDSISGDGLTVVGRDPYPRGRAAKWTAAEGIEQLELFPNATSDSAYGASYDGSEIVGVAVDSQTHTTEATLWTSSGVQGLGYLPGGGGQSVATAVSSDGSTVVGWGTDGVEYKAFRWNSGVMQPLPLLPGSYRGSANGVSADGSKVVGINIDSGPTRSHRGFLWDSSTGITALEVPGEPILTVEDVSDDGTVVVGFTDDVTTEVIRWVNGSPERLGQLFPEEPDRWSWTEEVSADGNVLVGGAGPDANGEQVAMVWDHVNGMRSFRHVLESTGLDLTDFFFEEARDVSDDGRTVLLRGWDYSGPSRVYKGWVATIPPVVVDSDGDGVPDDEDVCPESDLSQNIWFGGEDTGVENTLLDDGCTLSDLITLTLELSEDNGNADSVALLVEWKRDGLITGREIGAILKDINQL